MTGWPPASLAGFLDWEDCTPAESGLPAQGSAQRYSRLWCELTHSLLTGRFGQEVTAPTAAYVRLSAVEEAEVDSDDRQLLLSLDGGRHVILTAPDDESFAAWREAVQRALAEHSLSSAISATPSPKRLDNSSALLSPPRPTAMPDRDPASPSRSTSPGLASSSAGTAPPKQRSESNPEEAARSPRRRRRHHRRHSSRSRRHGSHSTTNRRAAALLAPPQLADQDSCALERGIAFVNPPPPAGSEYERTVAAPCLAPPLDCLADTLPSSLVSHSPRALTDYRGGYSVHAPTTAELAVVPPRSSSSLFADHQTRLLSGGGVLPDWRTRRNESSSFLRLRYGTGNSPCRPTSDESRPVHYNRWAEFSLGNSPKSLERSRSRSLLRSGDDGAKREMARSSSRELDRKDPLLCLCQPRRFDKHDAQDGGRHHRADGTPVYACLTVDSQHLVVIPADTFERRLRKAGLLRGRGDAPVALRTLHSARKFFGERSCLAMPVANIRAVRVGGVHAPSERSRTERNPAILCFLSRSHALLLGTADTEEATWLSERWNQLLRRQ